MGGVLKSVFIPILATALYAKPGLNADLDFETISLEQGLSQVTVYTIFQDHEGFLWFGTQDGLNRYDGYELKIFRHHPFNRHSISHNWIYSIAEDQHGDLWIGTRDGLNIYRRDRDQFELFTCCASGGNNLTHQDIQNIICDYDGSLWFNSTAGLYHYLPEDSSLLTYQWERDITAGEVNCFLADLDSNLWIGTNRGLFLYNRGNNRFKKIGAEAYSFSTPVNGIGYDSHGFIWMGTDVGLNCFDPQSKKFRTGIPDQLADVHIYAILVDRTGIVWLGTPDGLYGYDPQSKEAFNYHHDSAGRMTLSNNTVFSVYQDGSGLIWVGTYGGGVNKLNTQKGVFNNVDKRIDGSDGLRDEFVYAFGKNGDDSLLVGTDEGLDILDLHTNHVVSFRSESYPDLRLIRSVLRDSRGRIWVGTAGNGLFIIDDQNKSHVRIQRIRHDPARNNCIASNYILRIMEDRDGCLWIGTTGGLCMLPSGSAAMGNVRIFRHSDGDSSGLPANHIRALFEGSNGNIWIGTYGGGVARYNKQKDQFTSFRHDPEDTSSLSSDYIYSILEDTRGGVWIGSYGGGLNYMANPDADRPKIVHFYSEDGLPGNLIYGLLEDNRQNIWVSTNKGLAKCVPIMPKDSLNKADLVINDYDVSDGIQSSEFNFGGYYKDTDGRLFFGGVKGLTYFYPDSIKEKQYIPNIVITDFRVFNHSVPVGPESNLTENITQTNKIDLLYRQNVFTFEFAALDFTAPMKNKYAFMMEGFDSGWTVATAKNRRVTYTNLDPGEYVFKLLGTNSDGLWNPAERRVIIDIKPPFWLTWWFRVIWMGSVIVIIGIIYRQRIRRINRQKELLEQQVDVRTGELKEKTHQLEITNEELESFAYSVSHDLRSPLRAISGYSQMILEDFRDVSENRDLFKYLTRIQSGAHQMSNLIDAVLKLSRLTRGNLNISRVDLSTLGLNIIGDLRNDDPGQQTEMNVDPGMSTWGDQALLRTMLENLLGNAWKFTKYTSQPKICFGCKTEVQDTPDQKTYYVLDNGVGFDMQYSDRLFQPFQRLHSEKEFPGTGIGLATVKRIVNRHGGKIWVESDLSTGTTFYFTLPGKPPETAPKDPEF